MKILKTVSKFLFLTIFTLLLSCNQKEAINYLSFTEQQEPDKGNAAIVTVYQQTIQRKRYSLLSPF